MKYLRQWWGRLKRWWYGRSLTVVKRLHIIRPTRLVVVQLLTSAPYLVQGRVDKRQVFIVLATDGMTQSFDPPLLLKPGTTLTIETTAPKGVITARCIIQELK